jgi:serine/threonine protein phosphatase 1
MQYHQYFEKNAVGRDFVIGDIHGHIKRLHAALESVDFDESKDRLFSLGDLIDRGNHNVSVLKMLYEKSWFNAIRGNHEQMLIDRFELPPISPAWGKIKTCYDAEEQHRKGGGKWFDRLWNDLAKQRIYQNLAALPYAITLETDCGEIGLVHAEVPERFSDWSVFVSALHEDKGLREDALWNRYAIMDVYDPYVCEFYEEPDTRTISDVIATLHGHTPVQRPVVCGNQVWIDTGFKSGYLTIVEVAKVMDLFCLK